MFASGLMLRQSFLDVIFIFFQVSLKAHPSYWVVRGFECGGEGWYLDGLVCKLSSLYPFCSSVPALASVRFESFYHSNFRGSVWVIFRNLTGNNRKSLRKAEVTKHHQMGHSKPLYIHILSPVENQRP